MGATAWGVGAGRGKHGEGGGTAAQRNHHRRYRDDDDAAPAPHRRKRALSPPGRGRALPPTLRVATRTKRGIHREKKKEGEKTGSCRGRPSPPT